MRWSTRPCSEGSWPISLIRLVRCAEPTIAFFSCQARPPPSITLLAPRPSTRAPCARYARTSGDGPWKITPSALLSTGGRWGAEYPNRSVVPLPIRRRTCDTTFSGPSNS